mgnify:CR=1 FL=1
MFALVNKEDNSITKILSGNKGITIGENQYPQTIFTLWSEAERNAINIYTVEIDNSKKKAEEWYINTDITYSFDGSKAKGSYGDATAKKHADVNHVWTQEEIDNGQAPGGTSEGDAKKDNDGNQIITRGLKYILIKKIKDQAEGELNKTDWYVVRKAEEDTAIPSSITTHRKAVRSKQAEMETAITNASDTPALETLHTYTEQEDGTVTRPLGELPYLE